MSAVTMLQYEIDTFRNLRYILFFKTVGILFLQRGELNKKYIFVGLILMVILSYFKWTTFSLQACCLQEVNTQHTQSQCVQHSFFTCGGSLAVFQPGLAGVYLIQLGIHLVSQPDQLKSVLKQIIYVNSCTSVTVCNCFYRKKAKISVGFRLENKAADRYTVLLHCEKICGWTLFYSMCTYMQAYLQCT